MMNTLWTLLYDARGYHKGSKWLLHKIDNTGWDMEHANTGMRVHFSNPDLFKAGWDSEEKLPCFRPMPC